MSTQPLARFGQHLRASDRSEHTIEAYLRDLRLFREWFQNSNGDEMTPEAITPIDVREHKAYLLRVRASKPATVNRKLASISAFCEWVKKKDLVEANPAQGIGIVQEVELAPRSLTKKEQYALLRAVQREGNPRDVALIMLLFHTGLRVSEEVLLDAVETLKVDLTQGGARSRRRALRTFVQKIEVRDKTGTLYYTFPLHALALPQPVYIGSTPGATRTRAHGFGGRCSIRLSYGGTSHHSLTRVDSRRNPRVSVPGRRAPAL